MSRLKSINNTYLLIGIALSAIVLVGVGYYFVSIDENNSSIEDPEFDFQYEETGMTVRQTAGSFNDIQVQIQYLNGTLQSENAPVSNQSPTFALTFDSRLSDVQNINILVNGSVVASPQPSSQTNSNLPIESISDQEITRNELLQLSAEEFVSSGTDIIRSEWRLGDGTRAVTEQLSHEYDQSGSYEVILTVADAKGRIGTQSFNVTVEDSLILTDSISELPDRIDIGEEFELSAYNITSDNIDSYRWLMGDGTEYTQQSITHQYSTVDTYNVTLRVSKDGRTESISQTIQALSAP